MSENIDNKDKKLKENSKDVVEEKASEKIEAEKKDEVKKEEPKKEEPVKEDLNDSEVIDLNKVEEKQKQEVKKPEVKKSSTDFIMSKKKKKRRKNLIILAIIAILLVAGFFYIKKKITEAADLVKAAMASNIQTATVEKKKLVETVPATGTLVPRDVVTLSTILQSSSKIEEVNVEVGDYVEKDSVLVRFSTEDINKQISQTQEDIASQKKKDAVTAEDTERKYVNSYVSASTSLQSAAAMVNSKLNALHEACSDYGDAKRKLQDELNKENPDQTRVDSLQETVNQKYKAQVSAQEAYDEAVEAEAKAITDQQNSLSDADSSYVSSNLSLGDQVKSSKRQLEKLEDSLDNYIVTASISGIVTEVNVSEGNSFQSGSVLTIQDMSVMEVEVLVDEYDIPKVKEAFERTKTSGKQMSVEIKTNATEDNVYNGHVVSINPTSTSTASFSTGTSGSSGGSVTSSASSSSTPQYKVKVQLDDMDEAFMIGMTAKVSIIVDESPADALCVPYNAVEENEDGDLVVHVVDSTPGDNNKPDSENGIVVENNTSKTGKDDKKSSVLGNGNNQFDKLVGAKNMKDATAVLEESKPKTHDVKVTKIFDTDYYTAIVPVNPNELKEGDTVVIEDSKGGNANDMFNMMRGMDVEVGPR